MLAVLAPLASLLGLEADTIRDRLQRRAIIWGLVGAFGVLAVIFLLVAANTALAYLVGPVIAPLIIAAVALAGVIVVLIVGHLRDLAEARREAERKRSTEKNALVTTALVTALPLIVKSPLLKEIGIPVGAAIASALLLRRSRRSSPSDDAEPPDS